MRPVQARLHHRDQGDDHVLAHRRLRPDASSPLPAGFRERQRRDHRVIVVRGDLPGAVMKRQGVGVEERGHGLLLGLYDEA